jgi:exopolysaccharide biosynthesis protein
MNRWTPFGYIAAFTVLISSSALTSAHAAYIDTFGLATEDTSWNPLFKGIDESVWTVTGNSGGGVSPAVSTNDSSQAYVMRIDLTAPGIGFTTTPLASGGKSGTTFETMSQTTTQFLQSSGTQVAINASFFDPCGCSTTTSGQKWLEGLSVSNGTVVSPNSNTLVNGTKISGYESLLITKNNQVSFAANGSANLTGVYNAVTGDKLLVSGGKAVSGINTSSNFNDENPRSAVGLSQNGRFMYLVAIDGRQPGYSTGASLIEEANLLIDLGADTAINLDGGGSTALAYEDANGDPELLNTPSSPGGVERYDGNNFGVFAEELPEPATLPLLGSAVLGLMAVARRRFSF